MCSLGISCGSTGIVVLDSCPCSCSLGHILHASPMQKLAIPLSPSVVNPYQPHCTRLQHTTRAQTVLLLHACHASNVATYTYSRSLSFTRALTCALLSSLSRGLSAAVNTSPQPWSTTSSITAAVSRIDCSQGLCCASADSGVCNTS